MNYIPADKKHRPEVDSSILVLSDDEEREVALLMETYKNKPCRALFVALRQHTGSAAIPMAIINLQQCGMEMRSQAGEGPFPFGVANVYAYEGCTPLLLAALANRLDVVKILLALGADVKAGDQRFGRSAIMAAVSIDNIVMIQLLIEYGADIYERNINGSALHLAADGGRLASADLLISLGMDINDRNRQGMTPLHSAALTDNADLVRLLVAHGANVFETVVAGSTPLHYACSTGCGVAIPKTLIDNGAEVNAIEVTYGFNPLHEATVVGDAPTVLMLGQEGSHLEVTDNKGVTALRKAMETNFPTLYGAVQDALIAMGAKS